MDSVTTKLGDLVRLAFEGPVEWLAGDPQAAALVNWVTTSERNLQPDDIYLLPAGEASDQVIAQAQRRGAAAVVILGKTTAFTPKPVTDLALLTVPGIEDIHTAQRSLLTVLINQRAAASERESRIHTRLSSLVAEGEGLPSLAVAMVDISGHGVLVQDKRGEILAERASADLNPLWNDILTQLASLDSLPLIFQDRKLAGSQAHSITQEIPGGLVRLARPIIVSQVARGYLSLIGYAGELDTLDQVVLEQGCLACGLAMSRDKAIREAEKRLKGELLTALLQENLQPRDVSLWTQTMGLDLSQAHVALRFAWDGNDTPSRRRLETLVNGEISHLSLKVIVNPMGTEVTCFCQVPIEDERPELALKLGQAVLDQGRNEYPDIPARCGVGTPAEDLTLWRDSFRQAGQALEMARRLKERKPLYFPDLSVYRLLMQIEHNPELIAFQEETIGPLLAYEGSNDLLQTLETYFQHKGNLSQTAEALFIHRNTLLYRMERIKEILRIDLDKPESRLAVQLALNIYRMRGGQ